MRRISLNARLAQDAEATDAIEVVLIEITHPDLAAPIRLSTDATERISTEPLVYGTRSAWRGATEPWLWVVASALLPSDLDDAPAAATIELENLDQDMVALVRSFITPADVALAVVLASSPDLVEVEYGGLRLVSADYDAGSVSLSISREEIEAEYFPSGRLSRLRFPGLHL